MLVDTDVLIWFFRGSHHAESILNKIPLIHISSVSAFEILQGLRNQKELRGWKSFLKDFEVKVILLDESISSKALFWVEEYTLSHQLKMADALIAATADIHGLELLTGNIADYRFLPGIRLQLFKTTVKNSKYKIRISKSIKSE